MSKLSADRMVEILEKNPSRANSFKEHPLEELKKLRDEALEDPAYHSDKWFYRFAIIVLGSLALITAISAIILKGAVPEVLVSLGSTAVGALVGLFAPSPASN